MRPFCETTTQKEVGSSRTYSKSTSSGFRSSCTFVNAAGCTGRPWPGASLLCPGQPKPPLVFDQFVQQLLAFIGAVGLHQLDLETRKIAFQRCCLPRFRCRKCLSVFESPSQSSSAYAFQNVESAWHIAVLGDEFKMLQVSLTHRSSNRTVPVRLIHADEHALNHVFRLFVESVGFAQRDRGAPSDRRESSGCEAHNNDHQHVGSRLGHR